MRISLDQFYAEVREHIRQADVKATYYRQDVKQSDGSAKPCDWLILEYPNGIATAAGINVVSAHLDLGLWSIKANSGGSLTITLTVQTSVIDRHKAKEYCS